MASMFGQFCPVALASEVLTPKWTLLVVRELNAGATRFNEIRRGIPRISPTLLKQRLEQLEHAGVVERRTVAPGGYDAYSLTEAGRELKEVIAAVGTWGQRWAREIDSDDLDPGWLVWAMHRRIDTAAMPEGRTVIEFRFTDAPANHRLFWLVCQDPEIEVCIKHPGFPVDVTAITDTRCLAEIWRGLRPLRGAIADGCLRVEGSPSLVRAFPEWLMLSVFAGAQRRVG
jgi:DNA-binding HxlR family transcriptional regulator